MRLDSIPRVLAVISCVAVLALFAGPLLSAVAAPPQVTVFLKNYHEEYNLATTEFLAAQFDDLDSPAYAQVSYSVVTTLTQASLVGSAALIIDLSADMSLTAEEGTLIHNFVTGGGRVGLFSFPRFYWDHEGPNPAAFQTVADLFGNATVGEPNAGELASGISSAEVTDSNCVQGICFTTPYSVTGATLTTYDDAPFTPITSTGTSPVVVSTALGGRAVAVANSSGLLVTNAIGDLVQGEDASESYDQFVTDAIVWLAQGGTALQYKFFLPLVAR